MNNTCDLKLIQACHEEIEHRVSVYEKYKNPKIEEGAKNFQDYSIPWIDPSTQESIYADPTSFKTVTMKRKSKNIGNKNVVQATEDENIENNKESTKMSAIDEEIIEILKQTTKEDIYGALPFHEQNISFDSLPVTSLFTSGLTGSSQQPGWMDFPSKSLNFLHTNNSEVFDNDFITKSKSTMVSDSDSQHENSVKSNEIHKIVGVESQSVRSISKNGLSPDEIFANDPFFNSEPDFGVEFKSKVGTSSDADGKQIFFHNF